MAAYRLVRLRALRDHPDAFGASFEDEASSNLSHHIGLPPSVTFGGFANGALVATAALIVPTGLKRRHRGTIVGVYVVPEARGTGIGRGLMDAIVAHARATGLAVLGLTVNTANAGAKRLYQAAGFQVVGAEPRGLRVDGRFIDEDIMALLLD